jgi:hypothetical protein
MVAPFGQSRNTNLRYALDGWIHSFDLNQAAQQAVLRKAQGYNVSVHQIKPASSQHPRHVSIAVWAIATHDVDRQVLVGQQFSACRGRKAPIQHQRERWSSNAISGPHH